MKFIPLYFLIICVFAFVRNEETTETTTVAVDLVTTEEPLSDDEPHTEISGTIQDKPIALPLQRTRREPPVIYKQRIRVLRRRPKPRRKNKGPRPVYGPPKYSHPAPISHYSPSHTASGESSGYSYSPPYSHENPKESFSHSVLDVSSDFNIQSIPVSDYGGSKESYESGHGGHSSFDEETYHISPDSYTYPKPVEKKKPKKHRHQKPKLHEDTISYSYDPPEKSVEYDSHSIVDDGPGYSYTPKGKSHGKNQEAPSYSYDAPAKSHESSDSGYSYDAPTKSHGSPSPGYSYEPPIKPSVDFGSSYSYEPPAQSHGSSGPSYSYEAPGKSFKQPDLPSSGYSYDPPPEKSYDNHQDGPGYSYEPKPQPHGNKEQSSGYSYSPPILPYKPHETYGIPPAQPPSSSYGYPVFSNPTSANSNKHSFSSGSHTQEVTHAPSPPGSLYDLPSQSGTIYQSDTFGKSATPDYFSPDSTYSFTTNTNSYNSLPTRETKTVGGRFAEPPINYKTDLSNSGLSTSHFPLDHEHLSSTYGSPKSSYEVPIYDAIPFTTPTQDFYPPNLPSSYNPNNYQTIARGSNKVEVAVLQNTTQKSGGGTVLHPTKNKFEQPQINILPTLSVSLEELAEPSPDYLDHIIETRPKKKRKHIPKPRKNNNRHILDPADLDGAFSSETKVMILPATPTAPSSTLLQSTISAVLNNTSEWKPIQAKRDKESNKPRTDGDVYQVTIEKSHSKSYYAGASPADIYSQNQNTHRRIQVDDIYSRRDVGEISIQSPKIFVSNKKRHSSDNTRRGSVFDETLSYWTGHSFPVNHKVQ